MIVFQKPSSTPRIPFGTTEVGILKAPPKTIAPACDAANFLNNTGARQGQDRNPKRKVFLLLSGGFRGAEKGKHTLVDAVYEENKDRDRHEINAQHTDRWLPLVHF